MQHFAGEKAAVGAPPASSKPMNSCEGGWAEEVPEPKPFLGGFKNTRTGAVQHHASTQTRSPQPQLQRPAQVCSEAQTAQQMSRSAQTKADAYTQCSRPGWYEDTSSDRVLMPTGALRGDSGTWQPGTELAGWTEPASHGVRGLTVSLYSWALPSAY